MEKMLVHVEMNGLYTEGIYRKSGSACRAKELHHLLEKGDSVVSIDCLIVYLVYNYVCCSVYFFFYFCGCMLFMHVC